MAMSRLAGATPPRVRMKGHSLPALRLRDWRGPERWRDRAAQDVPEVVVLALPGHAGEQNTTADGKMGQQTFKQLRQADQISRWIVFTRHAGVWHFGDATKAQQRFGDKVLRHQPGAALHQPAFFHHRLGAGHFSPERLVEVFGVG